MHRNNWFDWILRIIGVTSCIFGAWGIEQSNHAGLAGAGVFIFSLPFLVVPILVSLALQSWKRLGTYLLCLIACPFFITYTFLPFYFYFRLMKNAYLKQVLLYFVIPVFVISVIFTTFFTIYTGNINKTDEILGNLDDMMWKCIQKQEKYGAAYELLPKLCDIEYTVNTNKQVCKYITKIDFDKEINYDSNKALTFTNGNKHLFHTKINSITVNNLRPSEKSCIKENIIIFKAEPSFQYRAPYDPVKKEDVTYTTYEGKFMTSSEWADIVWDKIYDAHKDKDHNKKELEKLNKKNNNSVQTFTFTSN